MQDTESATPSLSIEEGEIVEDEDGEEASVRQNLRL